MNTKTIARLTGSLTLIMALFSFTLSFNALTDLAQKHGVSIPPLFPFVVEFAVVIFSLNALYRSLSGERATWQWVLIIGSSLLAGVFNVAHAQADLLSQTMAAMPSLFLLLSFESFLSLVKHRVRLSAAMSTLADLNAQIAQSRSELEKTIATKTDALDKLNGQIEKAQARLEDIKTETNREISANVQDLNAIRQAKIQERRQEVLTLLGQGQGPKDIAAALNVDIKTIRRDIVALNGQAEALL